MHQQKTLAQILLILSVFNVVLTAPVVRDIHDTDDGVVVPFAARNVGIIMPKERRTPTSAEPPPSDASPLLQSPDRSTQPVSDSPPPLPEGTPPLSAPPPNGEASLDKKPTPLDKPASFAVSSPPVGMDTSPRVPATNHLGSASSEIVAWSPDRSDRTGTSSSVPDRQFTTPNEMKAAFAKYAPSPEEPVLTAEQQAAQDRKNKIIKTTAKGVAVLAITGGLATLFWKQLHHNRTTDPTGNWYVFSSSRLSADR